LPLTTLFYRTWAIFALEGLAFLAFFNLGSSGLSSTRTCLGICSEVAFLLDEVLLVEGFTFGVLTGTCVGTCLPGAFPVALTKVSSGVEHKLLNLVGLLFRRSYGFGSFAGSLRRFFGRFGGGF